jgi:hypothetical protein
MPGCMGPPHHKILKVLLKLVSHFGSASSHSNVRPNWCYLAPSAIILVCHFNRN